MNTNSLDFLPFQNRVLKQFRHLGKWARRNEITCFRLYDGDLPDFPVVLDWMDGDCVTWIHPRKKDDAPEKTAQYRQGVMDAILLALDLPLERLWIKERKVQLGIGQYSKLSRRQASRIVTENGLKFELNLSDYLDVGLFLDHRKTREMVRELADGLTVLNLFAYTGSFSCYAAAGKAASTITVDLNPNYCDWAKRNLALNGISNHPSHRVVEADCRHFLENTKSGKFDLVICDPPTFSNSKRKDAQLLSIRDDYPELIDECLRVLDSNGVLIFSTNARGFKLEAERLKRPATIQEISAQTLSEDFRGREGHRCWLIRKVDPTNTPALAD